MAEVADLAAAGGVALTPVMITVDPDRDTVETIGPPLEVHHPDFVGLTGGRAALEVAWSGFGIDIEEVFFDPEYGPVYAHGSFVYLLDPDGAVLTLLPPVLPAAEIARIVVGYATGES